MVPRSIDFGCEDRQIMRRDMCCLPMAVPYVFIGVYSKLGAVRERGLFLPVWNLLQWVVLSVRRPGIDAECRDCRRRVVLGFEKFLARDGDMPFPDFARLMKCSACGSRQVDVRPSWPSRS